MSFKINSLPLAMRLLEDISSMLSNDPIKQDQSNIAQKVRGGGNSGIIAGLAAGLVLALAGARISDRSFQRLERSGCQRATGDMGVMAD
jgi:hypothetical protein